MKNVNKCAKFKPVFFEYYVIPNISDNSNGSYFSPMSNDYPDWLDYLDFVVSEDSDSMELIDYPIPNNILKEGYVLVWDPAKNELEEILVSEEEFEDKYSIL